MGNKGFPGKIKNGFCIRKYQQIEKFPEECGNCISAWANREMRRCRNTVFALRDNPKTVSGGKIRAAEYAGGRSEARHTGNAKTVFFGTVYADLEPIRKPRKPIFGTGENRGSEYRKTGFRIDSYSKKISKECCFSGSSRMGTACCFCPYPAMTISFGEMRSSS